MWWCKEQDPGFTPENTQRVLDDLRRRGLVRIWDNTPDAFEWKN